MTAWHRFVERAIAAVHMNSWLSSRGDSQAAPEIPNAPDIPAGSYAGSCTGCSVSGDGLTLTCTQCVNTRAQRKESSIAVDACDGDDVIGNHDGVLACEPPPKKVETAEHEL